MASHFADRLCEAVRTKKTSLIVGLDPVYTRLPEAIRSHRQMNDRCNLRFLHADDADCRADGTGGENKYRLFREISLGRYGNLLQPDYRGG